MSVSRSALACAGIAGAIASLAVAEQRVGLALSVALAFVGAAAVLSAERGVSIPLAVVALALAIQPVLRDAGWVVAVDVIAVPVAVGVALGRSDTWRRLRRALVVPFRLVAGTALIVRTARVVASAMPSRHVGPLVRGLLLALALTVVFGGLFVAADKAFADLVDQTFGLDLNAAKIGWRLLLGLLFVAVAGALARGAMGREEPIEPGIPRALGRIELRIALSAVVALFAAFVVVQLHVLFGGAAYVQKTTGLGYGEYARQGFVQLLVVAALTLAVVGVSARRPDRAVRALLGALCILMLVVLVSAYHRLELVEDAYGLTRVRYAGDAVVAWFVLMFGVVITAGLSSAVAPRMPRVAAIATLAGVLVFSLSDPDARIAESAVARAAAGHPLDTGYLAGLSADALPELERLPEPERDVVVSSIRARLERPDGIAGANLSRADAR